MSTEHPHYEDFSTPELEAELERLLRQQESLRGELEAVLGPDPEGPGMWGRLQGQIGRVRTLLRPMAPFVGGAVQPWPRGQERLHLYAIPDTSGTTGTELLDELNRQGPILADHHDRVTAVPDEWLHVTIARLENATAGEADALADALSHWIDRLTTPPVWALMRPMVGEHGVLLDEGRPDPWRRPPGWSWQGSMEGVRSLLETGMRTADLEQHRLRSPQTFHLATAYCHTAGPGRALADRFGRTAGTVPVRVRELALVWARQDPGVPTYTWSTVASWPLARAHHTDAPSR